MAYGPSPDDYSMTPGHDWWTANAPGDGSPALELPPAPSAPPSSAPPAAAPPPPAGQQFGGVYDQIAQFFRQYTGQEPSLQQVAQWGTNIDQNYLSKIEQAIRLQGVQSGYLGADGRPKAAPSQAPAAGSTPSSSRWDEAWFRQNIGVPNNMQDLLGMQGKIEAAGGKLNKNAAGQWNGKITTPDGRIVDVMIAAGKGGTGFQWDEGPGANNGRAPDLLSPFPENFTSTPFQAPAPFTAPTADQAFNDQGFQFTLKQGQDALEKSAAANGTLLTTGTLKDLDQFSQGLASTQYDKVYNRDLGQYESNYGHAQTNYLQDRGNALQEYGIRHDLYNESQDRPYGKLMGLANLGAGMPGSGAYAAGASGTLTGIGNAQAASGLYGANAYQNAYGGLSNLGGYYAGQYMNRGNSYSPYGYGYGFSQGYPIPPPQGPGY